MEYLISIWTKNKKTGKYFIMKYITLTEFDIERMVLEQYKKDYDIDEGLYEYTAEIDET